MAGPTLALELAARGVPSVVLDEDDTVSIGSRSICQAKHSLEVWDRFGIAQRMVDKGITWEQGEVYLARPARSTASTCSPSLATSSRPS